MQLLNVQLFGFRLAEDREVVLYCDFHGHSKKQNVFIYGCDALDNPQIRLQSRVFPKMLSKNAPTMFSYKDSKFNVHKSKVFTRNSTVVTLMSYQLYILDPHPFESGPETNIYL